LPSSVLVLYGGSRKTPVSPSRVVVLGESHTRDQSPQQPRTGRSRSRKRLNQRNSHSERSPHVTATSLPLTPRPRLNASASCGRPLPNTPRLSLSCGKAWLVSSSAVTRAGLHHPLPIQQHRKEQDPQRGRLHLVFSPWCNEG
jgi:hypothetical protein